MVYARLLLSYTLFAAGVVIALPALVLMFAAEKLDDWSYELWRQP